MLSDNLLLTSVWLVPLIGMVAVLCSSQTDRTHRQMGLAGVHLGHVPDHARSPGGLPGEAIAGTGPGAPLATRAAANTLAEDSDGQFTVVQEKDGDLVVRRPWIPIFKIQYYLGVDGISLSLVVLTGLVSVLASPGLVEHR